MQVQDIKQMIEASIDGSEAKVTGDGSHFEAGHLPTSPCWRNRKWSMLPWMSILPVVRYMR